MTNNKLQQQIAELTAKHELEELAASMFSDTKVLTYFINNKKHFSFDKANEIKSIIEKLPPTETSTIINGASELLAELDSPYRLDIDNPPVINSFQSFKLVISYTSNDIEVTIKLPIDLINNFVSLGERSITDSEYHYFTNRSNLHKMKVCAYSFKSAQVCWYGGNKTLTDTGTVNNIIASLLS